MPTTTSRFGHRPRSFAITAVAGVTLLLGAACSAASGADVDAESAEGDTATVARLDGARPLALGPSTGPVGAAALEDAPPVVTDVTPPGLVVISPLHQASVDAQHFVFEGITEPGAIVSAGSIETVAAENGRWSIGITLAEGENVAVIKTTDDYGNSHEKEVVVSYEKPKPYVYVPPKEEHKEPKPDYHEEKPHAEKPEYEKPKPVEEHVEKPVKEPVYEFTARTKYGICTVEWVEKAGGEGSKDTDVLTKFIGNGVPGTAVKITSEYGSAITEVNDDGVWWVKLDFEPGAAEDEFWAVVTSGERSFGFLCGAI